MCKSGGTAHIAQRKMHCVTLPRFEIQAGRALEVRNLTSSLPILAHSSTTKGFQARGAAIHGTKDLLLLSTVYRSSERLSVILQLPVPRPALTPVFLSIQVRFLQRVILYSA